MEYRGLSNACFQMMEEDRNLKELITHICADPEDNVEIRHNYLNCYYKGGSLFRLQFKPKSSPKLEFTFDSKYFYRKGPSRIDYADLEKWNAAKPCDPKQWLDRLPELKNVMDAWFGENPKAERGIQGRLVKQNVFANGSYQSVDIELAVPGNQKAGRMDIIAVRRDREKDRYIPVIVELKHGSGSFDGDSGIRSHYEKIVDFLKHANGEAYLVETIRQIWASKKKLGLISGTVPCKEKFGEPELMFAVTGMTGGNTDENINKIRSRLPAEPEKYTVRIVISSGEELSFDNEESFCL